MTLDSEKETCELSLLLARELNRYQPHTVPRRAINRVIDAAIFEGMIKDLSPLASIEPSYAKKSL